MKLGSEERNADVRSTMNLWLSCPQKRYSHMKLQDFECSIISDFIGWLCKGHYADFFLASETTAIPFICSSLSAIPASVGASDEISLFCYIDSDEWPAHAPVGMWIDYGLVNEFLREWFLRKEQLKSGEISEDEYFEWKSTWPALR